MDLLLLLLVILYMTFRSFWLQKKLYRTTCSSSSVKTILIFSSALNFPKSFNMHETNVENRENKNAINKNMAFVNEYTQHNQSWDISCLAKHITIVSETKTKSVVFFWMNVMFHQETSGKTIKMKNIVYVNTVWFCLCHTHVHVYNSTVFVG